MRPLWPTLASLALGACQPLIVEVVPSPARQVEGAERVSGVMVESATGDIPLPVRARAVNAYRAAIPGSEATLAVGGTSERVIFDATGYGWFTVEEEGEHDVSGALEPATITALAATWPGMWLNVAHEAPFPAATDAVPVTDGSLVVSGTQVSWVGPEGTPHEVLLADAPVEGIRSGHADVDGNLDAVVWTRFTVFVLRGRTGGMSWGAAFEAPGYDVGGADVGDLSGDNIPDLAIAWAGGGTNLIDVWNGDGLLGYTAAEPRILDGIPIDLAVGDNTGEGKSQITVLYGDGTWARFIAGTETRYMPIGPLTPLDFSAPPASTLRGRGDLSDDRADDLWVLAPREPGVGREIWALDLTGFEIEFVKQSPVGGFVDVADADSNSIADLLMLDEDRNLQALYFDTEADRGFSVLPRAIPLPAHAPFTMADVLELDLVPDLFLAADDLWWFWTGHNDPDRPDLFWEASDPLTKNVIASIGQFAVTEVDGDPATNEVVTFEARDGSTLVHLWAVEQLGEVDRHIGGAIASSLAATPDDVAVCDATLWTLIGGTLVRLELTPTGVAITDRKQTQARRVACGTHPSGATAAILSPNLVELLDDELVVVDTIQVPVSYDLAMGEIAGGVEVRTCETPDCSIVYWPYGRTEAGFLQADPDGAALRGTNVTVLRGSGRVAVADVDLNGYSDGIVFGEDGLAVVYRSTGAGLAPPHLLHTARTPLTAPWFADGSGDGYPDFWFLDDGGTVRHTLPLGFEVEPETDPGTTAPTDTGGGAIP